MKPRFRAKIHARREKNKFARRGFIYNYYMEIRDQDGRLWSSDNTGNWRVIYDCAAENIQTLDRAWRMGVLKPEPPQCLTRVVRVVL